MPLGPSQAPGSIFFKQMRKTNFQGQQVGENPCGEFGQFCHSASTDLLIDMIGHIFIIRKYFNPQFTLEKFKKEMIEIGRKTVEYKCVFFSLKRNV